MWRALPTCVYTCTISSPPRTVPCRFIIIYFIYLLLLSLLLFFHANLCAQPMRQLTLFARPQLSDALHRPYNIIITACIVRVYIVRVDSYGNIITIMITFYHHSMRSCPKLRKTKLRKKFLLYFRRWRKFKSSSATLFVSCEVVKVRVRIFSIMIVRW